MSEMTGTDDAVVLERQLDADVELVWRMWTDPEHFAAWYGPTGATITVSLMDVRVGGRRLVGMSMPTPDGPMEMWFTGEHLEVDRPHRLVYSEAVSDDQGNVRSAAEMGMPDGHPVMTEVRVELAAAATGTRLVLTHTGVPADSPGATGWQMALDALATHLADQ